MQILRKHWLILAILSLIWGSSFILMKKALIALTPIQVGALRIVITAFVLIVIGHKGLRSINMRQWWYIFVTALLGTFFPVFLFAYAISHIDSSITSILNSLTPINTLLIGSFFFGLYFKKLQLIGVLVGLIGTTVLIYNGALSNTSQNYWFAVLPIVASVGYAFNVNILKKHLSGLSALTITTGNFIVLVVPASILLVGSNFFYEFTFTPVQTNSFLAVCVLAVIGTAIAKTLFNNLVIMTSPIFSTSVTYLIPIVAVFWGMLDGEKLSISQVLAGVLILTGVYITNRK